MYRRLPSMQSFYYDNIHFNHHEGLAVLKNALLSQLLRTSSGVSTKHYTTCNRNPMRTSQYTTHRWHIPSYTLDTDNKTSTSATIRTMKCFYQRITFSGFLILSATTPTMNDMKLRSNKMRNRRICYLLLAISVESVKKANGRSIIKYRILIR